MSRLKRPLSRWNAPTWIAPAVLITMLFDAGSVGEHGDACFYSKQLHVDIVFQCDDLFDIILLNML